MRIYREIFEGKVLHHYNSLDDFGHSIKVELVNPCRNGVFLTTRGYSYERRKNAIFLPYGLIETIGNTGLAVNAGRSEEGTPYIETWQLLDKRSTPKYK